MQFEEIPSLEFVAIATYSNDGIRKNIYAKYYIILHKCFYVSIA